MHFLVGCQVLAQVHCINFSMTVTTMILGDMSSWQQSFACKKKALVKHTCALLCMAKSLLYKKTNSSVGYMFVIPQTIEKHNNTFAVLETTVVDGPTAIKCKGCNGQAHSFLEAERVSLCVACNSSLCHFCVWVDFRESDSCQLNYCLECTGISLGVADEMTEQEMPVYMKQQAVNVPIAATYANVLRL
jgi:hypothetical protein